MKTIILSIISFAAFTTAYAAPPPPDFEIVDRLTGTQMASASYKQCRLDCIRSYGPEGYYTDSCIAQCSEDSNKQSSVDIMDRLNSTQTAYDYNACIDDCSHRAIDPNFDAAQCDQDCEQYIPSNQASVDIMDRLNGTQTFASSVRIGDPQPMCGTDAWACFNGTDDESPMIRDVGIFGVFASGDCHHPLGCGY